MLLLPSLGNPLHLPPLGHPPFRPLQLHLLVLEAQCGRLEAYSISSRPQVTLADDPPLTTGQLNTSTQVRNMAMLHLIYNGHTYLHHINITFHSLLHTSSTLLGKLADPDLFCQKQQWLQQVIVMSPVIIYI